MNTAKDLLTGEALEAWNKLPHPFNLSYLYEALKKKLEEEPDYEVWVPLVYYKYDPLLQTGHGRIRTPYNTFISNQGNVVTIRGGKVNPLARYEANDYYYVGVTYAKNKAEPILLHRALACSFIPVPDDLMPDTFSNLQVNHIDGVKLNPILLNLEWVTHGGNIDHAKLNGLIKDGVNHHRTKPVKAKILTGEFKDTEFVLCGHKEFKEHGFSYSHIYECCLGKAVKYKNCAWSYASKEDLRDLPKGVTPDIRANLSIMVKPVKSEILATQLSTGETKIITGGLKELKALGFQPTKVSVVLSGRRKQHRGFSFKRI